jgi:hypothetical protein
MKREELTGIQQVLLHYVNKLFPDVADIPGKQVVFKIDGGQEDLVFKAWQSCKVWVCIGFRVCKTPPMSCKKQIKIRVSSKACSKSTYNSFLMSCMQSI